MLPLNPLSYDLPIVEPKSGVPTPQLQSLVQALIDRLQDAERRLKAGGL